MRLSSAQKPAITAIPAQDIQDTETAASGNAAKNTSYRWVEGTCLKEYGTSAAIWKQHTSTPEFAPKFMDIMQRFEENNNERA